MSINSPPFCYSKNSIRILCDPVASHTATHFADTPQIKSVVKEILEKTVVSGDKMRFDVDTGVILGDCDLVETDETDNIVYAVRKNRDRAIRFTKSRAPQPSSFVAIILIKIDDSTYELYSAWLGRQTPSTPNSPFANEDSESFWSNHALVWGVQEVQPGTETTICPW